MRREFGKQRRRGKSSQPYRLVFLEGVSSSLFSFGLAELSNPHADIRK